MVTQVTNGRHRFAATTEKHFGAFFKLLNEKPQYVRFLADKGAETAPMDLLCAVEKGLRSHGTDLHAMGTNAMRSEKDWAKVFKWMKREGYIAAVRQKWGRSSYCQWDHFEWQDYVERKQLAATFEARHLPYSNGKEFGSVENPAAWSLPTPTTRVSSKSRRRINKCTKTVTKKTVSKTVMVWSDEKNELIPLLSDSDSEHQ